MFEETFAKLLSIFVFVTRHDNNVFINLKVERLVCAMKIYSDFIHRPNWLVGT